MSYYGDITLEDTIRIPFNTSDVDGVPITLAGTPVLQAHEDGGTTEITSGVSVTVDFDSITGLHIAVIVATAANGFEAGKDYVVNVDTGTVDGQSVAGAIIGTFSIQNRSADTVLGKVGDAAADGDPTTTDTLIGYIKQLINILIGTAGVVSFPSSAAPGNGVSVVEVLRSIYDDSNELQVDDYPTRFGSVDTAIADVKTVTDALGAAAAAQLSLSANQIITGTVDTATNSHTPTTTEFQADDITEATADHYNGRIIIFTSGVLAGQATSISDYEAVGGIGQFTVVALTEAPANNDTFIIL